MTILVWKDSDGVEHEAPYESLLQEMRDSIPFHGSRGERDMRCILGAEEIWTRESLPFDDVEEDVEDPPENVRAFLLGFMKGLARRSDRISKLHSY